MHTICKQLLKDTVGDENCFRVTKDEYQKLCRFASTFPDIDIKVETNINDIQNQWVKIAIAIVKNSREDLVIPTLFAATKKIMKIYAKSDVSIPQYHALWLDEVIKEIESSRNIMFFYFLILTVLMMFICR